jgi:hypothetical protein
MHLGAFALHRFARSFATQLTCCTAAAHLQAAPNGKTRAAKFPRATRRNSILATGSAGAASTDTFIDITLQEQRDCAAGRVRRQGSRASPYLGMPCWDARVQLRHGVRVCLQGPPAVTSTPWRPRDRRTSKAATTACGHDRRRCTRAQSQHAVPGQPMGRGAGVDRPGPAITRL